MAAVNVKQEPLDASDVDAR